MLDLTKFKVYVVGGYCRDRILGRNPKDHDFVVVGATPQDMIDAGFQQVGADFPVFLSKSGDEYALARTERKTSEGYQGFETDFNPDITLEDDLVRRDLTINAMAREVIGWNEKGHAKLNDEIIDLFNGQDDLHAGILRHVSDAFAEDPVRILRTARFAARYEFEIAPDTIRLMASLVENGELDHLVPERVWTEFTRAMEEPSPSEFFWALDSCGALQVLFPELYKTHIQASWPLAKSALYELNTTAKIAIALHKASDADQLLDRMKAPTNVKRISRKLHTILDAFDVPQFNKQKAFLLAQEIDAFGNTVNDVIELSQAISMLPSHIGEQWDFMLFAIYKAKNITFSSLTEEQRGGLKGSEIKEAINTLRLRKMGEVFG